MAHLRDWNWIVGRRKIDVGDWFKREGIDTYEKAVKFARSRGLTSPNREQFEAAIARPRVGKSSSNNSSSSTPNNRPVPKKRRRKTKKKASTSAGIAAVEAIEKSKKVELENSVSQSSASNYFRKKRNNAKEQDV
jgi:hypothetical protein